MMSDNNDQVAKTQTLESESAQQTGFDVDEAALPKGYFYSPFFVGSYLAIGLGLWAGTAAL